MIENMAQGSNDYNNVQSQAQIINNMAQGSNDYNNVHSQAHMSNGHIR